MIITIITEKKYYQKILPLKITGQHWIQHENNYGNLVDYISIIGEEDRWVLYDSKNVGIYDEIALNKEKLLLEPGKGYLLYDKSTGEELFMLVNLLTSGNGYFEKYHVEEGQEISIGRKDENSISYGNEFLDEKDIRKIVVLKDKMIIEDKVNMSKTFVNHQRVEKYELKPGDLIFIIGLKIIIGKGFIAVNNPEKKVISKLPKLLIEELSSDEKANEDLRERKKILFSSSPREKKPIVYKTWSIDSPPVNQSGNETPWIFLIGPSLTMAIGSMAMSLLSLQNIMSNNGDFRSAIPTLVMSAIMVIGTVVWPVFAKRSEKRRIESRRKHDEKVYFEYLDKIWKEIQCELVEEKTILLKNHPNLENCIKRIKERSSNLWERSMGHDDFLEVMVGIGNLPMTGEIKYPEVKTTMTPEVAIEAFKAFRKQPKILEEVPVTLNIPKHRVLGIVGKRSEVISLIKALLIELTALHNYDDLKLMFIYDEKEKDVWSFSKWLPHVWTNDRSFRFVAKNLDEIKSLSAKIEQIKDQRENMNEDSIVFENSHYVIIAGSKELAEKSQVIKELYKSRKNLRITIIVLYDEEKYLPKSSTMVIAVEGKEAVISGYNDLSGEKIIVNQRIENEEDIESLFSGMFDIELDILSKIGSLPREMKFLEMFKIGKPEQYDALEKWKRNNPVESLGVPIGIDVDGYPIILDIHEKAHGPHGLIAGMTGSGKSEFIISYISAMAMNFHPHEVSFILIDFKGGGMAGVFKDLPHLAGSITNLENNELNRALTAIEAELTKRQKIFKEIGDTLKISNIDIYHYQRLYREGRVKNSLSHMIIISDEFAELKQQHSEFMEQLIRTARIGRSLGVHLILATQKPEGIVDDQIKSNIKFKVCLRVQEKGDSQSVIDKPDAATLTNPGRFYFQVGFNEIFILGQSPWSGGTYFPKEMIRENIDYRVALVSGQGIPYLQCGPPPEVRPQDVPEKEVDAIVNNLMSIAEKEKIKGKKIWQEPLPGPTETSVVFTTEPQRFILNPIIGNYDDLENQSYEKLSFPFTENGNVLLFGTSGSGKTDVLNQLLFSVMERHQQEEVEIHILDFDGGSLEAFSPSPFVGGVYLPNDEEKIENLLLTLQHELNHRKELFNRYGGMYQRYIKETKKVLPNILLIIHNYTAFSEFYESREYEKGQAVAKLAREGRKYGIFLLITALEQRSLYYWMQIHFSQRYTLQLNNDDDYGDILGNVNKIRPAKYKGRGIFKRNNKIYEFQTKIIFENESNVFDKIKAYCEKLEVAGLDYEKSESLKIPDILDVKVLLELLDSTDEEGFPIGLNALTGEMLRADLDNGIIYPILSSTIEGIKIVEGLSEIISGLGFHPIELTVKNGEETVKNINDLMSERSEIGWDAKETGKPIPNFERKYYIIRESEKFFKSLSERSLKLFCANLGTLTINYHMHFIIYEEKNEGSLYLEYIKNVFPVKNGISFTGMLLNKNFFDCENNLEEKEKEGYGYAIQKGVPIYGKFVIGE